MSRKQLDKNNDSMDVHSSSDDAREYHNNTNTLATKLDRRRRIEELNEERMARDDFSAF